MQLGEEREEEDRRKDRGDGDDGSRGKKEDRRREGLVPTVPLTTAVAPSSCVDLTMPQTQ